MSINVIHIESCELGLQSSRRALRLSMEDEQILNAGKKADAWWFSLGVAIYLGLWSAGVLALLLVREQPMLQGIIAIFVGSQLHAITVLQHDCGHRSAYKSVIANLWVGRVLAWFVFMPFTTFTQLHRHHHGFLGQKDKDPDEWFYERGPVLLFLRECCFMPRFIYLSLTRELGVNVRRDVLLELGFNALGYIALGFALIHSGYLDVLVFGFALPLLLLACVFNPISRGYEHYPLARLPADDPRREDLRFNTVTVTSRLIGLLWANINYHVEHHMYPRVPFHRLPRLNRLLLGKHYTLAPYPLSVLEAPSLITKELLGH